VQLHDLLVSNLHLSMSVCLNSSVRDAQKLFEEKARFRDLERTYAGHYLDRLYTTTVQSLDTSSLHGAAGVGFGDDGIKRAGASSLASRELPPRR